LEPTANTSNRGANNISFLLIGRFFIKTFLAQPEQYQVIHVYLELPLALDPGEQSGHHLVRQRFYATARLADQMVMWCETGDLVNFASPNVGCNHQSHLAQKVQRAVYSSLVDRRGFGLHPGIDFIERGVSSSLANSIKDQLTLGREPETLFSDFFCIIQAVV